MRMQCRHLSHFRLTVLDQKNYNSTYHQFRVTGLVLKFIRCLRSRASDATPVASILESTVSDFNPARLYWIKDCQSRLHDSSHLTSWKHHLDLKMNQSSVWRCGGRMSKSCLTIVSPKSHIVGQESSPY